MTDLYEILRVDRNASTEEIKFAYRSRSKELHPDTGGSTEEFQQLRLAYTILKNPKSRIEYDTTGEYQEGAVKNDLEESRNMMVEIFNECLNNPDTLAKDYDLIKGMKRVVMQLMANENTQLQDKLKYKRKLESLELRLTIKPNKENILGNVIKGRIQKIEQSIQLNQNNLRIQQMTLDELENYQTAIELILATNTGQFGIINSLLNIYNKDMT